MKKIIYIIFTLLQILLGVGAYLVQDFSMKRMGMMRHVVVQNRQWELQFSINTIQGSVILSFVIITLLIIFLELRKKQSILVKRSFFRIGETIFLTVAIISFILLNTTESYRSYYFICFFLILILGLQYLKHLLYFIKLKKRSIT